MTGREKCNGMFLSERALLTSHELTQREIADEKNYRGLPSKTHNRTRRFKITSSALDVLQQNPPPRQNDTFPLSIINIANAQV